MPARSRRSLFAGVLALVCATGVAAAATATADETTIGYHPTRDNWDNAEPGLVSGTVTQPDFGQLWSTQLPGTTTSTPNQTYAQPLVADGKVIVATDENQVDALDPKTGKVDWTRSLGPAWTPTPTCGDLVPHVGITSTPVYDPAGKTLYLVTKTDDGTDSAHPNMRVHALSVTDGSERSGWPVAITGTSSNGGQAFNAATANQRAGLLLMNGGVFFATASHCDHGPYVGFVGRVSIGTTPALKLWAAESGSATDEAGIWQSGGGIMADGTGDIYVATGNGVSPTPGAGTQPPGTLGESVVRLAVAADGTMKAVDFFSPANNAKLDQDDADLGSGGPVALPDSFGTTSHKHLLVVAGKDGTLYLLDRDNLGGMGQGPGGTDKDVDSVSLKGVWGHAAVFAGSGATDHFVYILPSQSPLQALRVGPDSNGVPNLSTVAASSQSFAYTSGSPIVTSDGATSSSALVWVVAVDGSNGANGVLQAFPAVPPTSGSWKPLVQFPLGSMAKFVQPATDGGRVFVGTRDGRVLAFGRPATAALTGSSTDFGQTPVNTPAPQQTVTLKANADLRVDSVDTSVNGGAANPFSVDPVASTTLAAGGTLAVTTHFDPTAPGTTNGAVIVHTTVDGTAQDFSFGLTGTGTQDGEIAAPSSLDFGQVAVGQGKRLSTTIQNTGTTTATVQSFAASLGADFTVTDAPSAGYRIPAQGSVTVGVQFMPSDTGDQQGSLTLTTDEGSPLQVDVSATGFTGSPHMSISSTSLDFGQVEPGAQASKTFTVNNDGTTPLTITKAAPPSAPFVVTAPINEGQVIEPGDSLTISVTAAPSSAEPVTDVYSVTGDDGQGPVKVGVKVNTASWAGNIYGSLGCATLKSGISANGTPVVDYTCSTSGSQRRALGAASSLRLRASTSTYCLDAKNSGTANGTKVQLYTCNGTAAQMWTWRSDDSLYNPHSGKCLDVPGGSKAVNIQLQLYTCNRSTAQYRDLSTLQSARGALSSRVEAVNELCMDIRGAKSTSGTPVQLYHCNLSQAQMITRVSGTLRALDKCIDAVRGGTANGTKIDLYQCNGTAAQVFTPRSDGSLYNAHSGKCLDDPKRSTNAGTQLQLYTCNGTVAQRWNLPG